MNPEKATHCKDIRKILKEALHDNKDLNLYLESGGKHAKLTDGAHSLTSLHRQATEKARKTLKKN
ncbi:hypothetical protein HpHA283_08470 [Helicobacter pylori]